MQGENGAPDFQALQNAFEQRPPRRIVYWLFDLPFLDGVDLRAVPLESATRAAARDCSASRPPAQLRFSEVFDAAPRDLLASSAQLGFEGIIGKRKGLGLCLAPLARLDQAQEPAAARSS